MGKSTLYIQRPRICDTEIGNCRVQHVTHFFRKCCILAVTLARQKGGYGKLITQLKKIITPFFFPLRTYETLDMTDVQQEATTTYEEIKQTM